MNNLKSVLNIFKYILLTPFVVLKFCMSIILFPFTRLYKYVNKRLKFSITFKITTIYALVLTMLLFVIWIAIAAVLARFGYLEENTDFFGILIASLMFTFLLVVVLSIFIGSLTTRKMLRPVNRMIGTVKSITAGALNTRLDVVDSYDELKELAETFNGMLDRIQTSYEQQNRFVSDASHELRTPISVIQGYANLLHRWGKEDRAVLEESLSAVKNEADSMKELVEKLLFLARADNNTQKLEKSIFSLDELLDEVIKETKLIDAAHEISGERIGMITLQGDKGLIKQALRIFIDNSIKYTPGGGAIRISSCLADGRATLTVEDTGIGISKDDMPHIFDRFYKCDKSRSRESSSTGLGLSIAKWIVEKHEGSIKVESEINKGTKIIICLPVH